MLSVVILGFPRTATTAIYVKLRQELKDHVAVFEPFNPDCVIPQALDGYVTHDVLGFIGSDFHKLPLDLQHLVVLNSYWYFDWLLRVKPNAPWLGWCWREIFRRLDELDKPILLKDVVAWSELEYPADHYKNTLFIVTNRDVETVLKAFKQWYVPYTIPYKLLKLIKNLKRNLTHEKLRLGINYVFSIKMPPALRVLKVYGKRFGVHEPKIKTWLTVKFALRKVYKKYLEIVDRFAERKNVLRVSFYDQLTKNVLEAIVGTVKLWLRR